METATTHEARARNAKAQALAAVLLEAGATPADLETATFVCGSVAWALAAQAATARQLLGEGRQVHAPNSQATIDAVARILGDLIAHEADQAAIAEQVAPANPHDTEATIPLADMTQDDWDTLAVDDEAYVPPTRRPTDSQGYRRTVGQLDRETAQAFAAFKGMAG